LRFREELAALALELSDEAETPVRVIYTDEKL
jgi:hypothetical protein